MLNAQFLFRAAVERCENGSQPRAFHMSAADEFRGDLFCNVRGDRKTEPDIAAGGRENEVVDSDDFALNVQERSSGVAGIDGGIGLHVAFMQVHSRG